MLLLPFVMNCGQCSMSAVVKGVSEEGVLCEDGWGELKDFILAVQPLVTRKCCIPQISLLYLPIMQSSQDRFCTSCLAECEGVVPDVSLRKGL
jgi:hypothetical protein